MRFRSFQARALLVFLTSLTAVQVITFALVYFVNTRNARMESATASCEAATRWSA